MKIFLMIGPPFSGKGTQCKLLAKKIGVKHISTGDIIRNEIEKKSEFGILISEYPATGRLVPDEFIIKLLMQVVKENVNEKSIIIDGFPRTKKQVDFFIPFLKRLGLGIDLMIILDISPDELKKRGQKRRSEEHRYDDSYQIQNDRLKVFEFETRPAVEYLKTKVPFYEVSAECEIEVLNRKILKKIE